MVEQLYDVPTTASILNVKTQRVYELIRSKRLRAVRVGRQLRVQPGDLQRFIERNRVGWPEGTA